jgi:hypothetical protein
MIAGPLLSGSVSETLGYYWMNTVLGELLVFHVGVEDLSDYCSCPRIAHDDLFIFLDDGGAEERDGGGGLIGSWGQQKKKKKAREKNRKNTKGQKKGSRGTAPKVCTGWRFQLCRLMEVTD